MAKLTLSNLSNLQNETSAVTAINANSDLIETAVENTLSRDGASPNMMNADLDMNSNEILNMTELDMNSNKIVDLANGSSDGDAVNFSQLNAAVIASGNIPFGGTTGQILTKNSSADFDVEWSSESSELTAGSAIIITGTSPATISVDTGTSGHKVPFLDVTNTFSANQNLTVGQDSATQFIVSNSSAGTSALTGVALSNGTGSGSFRLGGTGYTGESSLFQNRLGFNASSASSGIAFVNNGALPTIFAASNVELARVGPTTVLTLSPSAASNNTGLYVNQSGPASGTAAGPISLNLIDVTSYNGGSTTAGSDTFGLFNKNVMALRVNFAIGGSTVGQAIGAGLFATKTTSSGATGDIVALAGAAYSTHTQGGGLLFGLVGQANADTSYSGLGPCAFEADIASASGASSTRRMGISIANFGAGRASGSVDGAVVVGSNTVGGEFKNVILISKHYLQFPTYSSTAFLAADTASTPINHILDLSNFTISGNIINSTPVVITGAGVTTLLGGSVTFANSTSSAQTLFTNQITANAVKSSIELFTPTSASDLYLAANGTSNTGTFLGFTRTGYVEINCGLGNGILFGTTVAQPIIFGTNNTEKMRLFSSGGLSVGSTTDPAAAGIVNVLTGFRIGNAAASGNFLIGDGTNFISTALGTNVRTFLGTPSSANLAAAITDETGSGALVFATSPALVTPALGVATATSLCTGTAATLASGVVLGISGNAQAFQTPTFSGTLLQFQGANSTAVRVYLDTFAASSSFVFRRANGTAASRTAVQLSDQIGAFFWDGFDGTGYNASDAPAIFATAAENFTTSNHGTDIWINVVPTGSLLSKRGLTCTANGNLVVGAAAAISTSANDGFVYIPTCAGAPSGTPTTYTGKVAIIYDTTNNQLYVYNSGWKQPKTPAGAALVTWQT